MVERYNMNQIVSDRYEIREKLGQGAMAFVYRAWDREQQIDVALKVLSGQYKDHEIMRRRFLREAGAMARLRHPAIASIYHYGEDGEYVYYSMALMEGGNLAQRMAKQPLPLQTIVFVLKRIAEALDYIHLRRVIHRDLKPANILFDRYNQSYLVDFGVVHLENSKLTSGIGKAIIGTPAYISPEQINGEADRRGDIYSLGIILFEMLTGEVPFKGETSMGTLWMHLNDKVPSIRDYNSTLSPKWQRIIEKALHKEADKRYQYAADLVDDVEELLKLSVDKKRSEVAEKPGFKTNSLPSKRDRPSGPLLVNLEQKKSWKWGIFGGIVVCAVVALVMILISM